MKVGVLALQGAFREHREVLDALGVEAVEVRTPEQLGALDALILPGGESTTMSKLLDSSGAAGAARRAAGRRPAGVRHLRGDDPARARGASTAAPTRSRSAPSTSRCGATPTAASATRSRPLLEVDGLAGRTVPRRVHPGAAHRVRRATGVEVLARHDGHPVLARQGPVWVASFHPELSGDLRLHEPFLD